MGGEMVSNGAGMVWYLCIFRMALGGGHGTVPLAYFARPSLTQFHPSFPRLASLAAEYDRSILQVKMKSVKMVNVESHEPYESVCYGLFGAKSSSSFFCLCMDLRDGGHWILTQTSDGGIKKLGRVAESSANLRQNVFFNVQIEIKQRKLCSIFANGKNIFNDVSINGGDEGVGGSYGIMCKGSRCVVKDWSVAYFRANGNAQYEYKMDNNEELDIPEDERVVEMEYGGMDGEERKFVPMIMNDVVSKTAQSIDFNDIVGLNSAKALLNETVVWPLILPQLFTGIREPWRGVLLFGPPGTGKTLLAKAVAGQNGSTFFNCSTATLVSKFRGESEKIVRCLFFLAKYHSPSVVFLDEVDALVGTRGAEGEHEASRRFKTELFVQIDGIVTGGSKEEPCLVTVLAASNNPWDLDEAMRRRLEKRIFVGLPDETVRKQMFTKHVESMGMAGGEGVDDRLMDILADRTEGYSGADVELVCREAKMKCMRRLLEKVDVEELVDATEMESGGDEASVTDEDLVQALEGVKKTVRSVDEYVKWEKKFGCRI